MIQDSLNVRSIDSTYTDGLDTCIGLCYGAQDSLDTLRSDDGFCVFLSSSDQLCDTSPILGTHSYWLIEHGDGERKR